MEKKQVIIDTNFLLIPGQFKVDIFSEINRIMTEPYELFIVEKTIEELNRIIMAAGRDDKFAAKLGLVLTIQKSLKRLPSSNGLNTADDDIVDSSSKDTYVATQDAELRKRLRKKGAKIIGLRQKRYLVMD